MSVLVERRYNERLALYSVVVMQKVEHSYGNPTVSDQLYRTGLR